MPRKGRKILVLPIDIFPHRLPPEARPSGGPLHRRAIDKTHLLVAFIGLRLGVFREIFGFGLSHGDLFSENPVDSFTFFSVKICMPLVFIGMTLFLVGGE